jgi:hypothetical protein
MDEWGVDRDDDGFRYRDCLDAYTGTDHGPSVSRIPPTYS